MRGSAPRPTASSLARRLARVRELCDNAARRGAPCTGSALLRRRYVSTSVIARTSLFSTACCPLLSLQYASHRNFKETGLRCAKSKSQDSVPDKLCATRQCAVAVRAVCLRRLRASGWIVPCREHPSTSNSWAPPGARVVRHVLWGPADASARCGNYPNTLYGSRGDMVFYSGSGFDSALWTTKPKTGFARPGGWFHTAHTGGRRSRWEQPHAALSRLCSLSLSQKIEARKPVDRELKRPSDFMKWRCI